MTKKYFGVIVSGVGAVAMLAAPVLSFAYDFTSQVATSTQLAVDIASAMFSSFLNLLGVILPYAIGIFIVYVGIHWARRALSGR